MAASVFLFNSELRKQKISKCVFSYGNIKKIQGPLGKRIIAKDIFLNRALNLSTLHNLKSFKNDFSIL